MLETRQQRRTDCATTAPMPTARPRASRSSPEAALRCAAGAGLDGDPRGRATLGRAVWCGATNQPPRRCTPPPRKWRDITHPNHPQFQPTNLKNKGYNLEHSFGHGKQSLAAVLVALNLLAFAIHTVCDIGDDLWRAARGKLGPRYNFFNKLAAITAFLIFPSWDDLLLTLAFAKPSPLPP